MLEVLPHIVSAKRQHCHGIPPHLSHSTDGRRSHFRTHRCADICPVFPIARLKDERHSIAPTSAENYGADGNAAAIFNMWVEHGIVAHGSGEAAGGMSGFFLGSGCPSVTSPVNRMGGRRDVLAFPPRV